MPYHQQPAKSPMSLNTLPNEVKYLILQAAPDIPTLSALVHSSPDYHTVYLTIREECLTEVTIRDLIGRDIDILTPMTWVEVGSPNLSLDPSVKSALEACYAQSLANQPIRLTIPQCCSLMTLTDLCGWKLTLENDSLIIDCTRTARCHTQTLHPGVNLVSILHVSCKYRLDFSTYHLVVLQRDIVSPTLSESAACLRLQKIWNDSMDNPFICYLEVKYMVSSKR